LSTRIFSLVNRTPCTEEVVEVDEVEVVEEGVCNEDAVDDDEESEDGQDGTEDGQDGTEGDPTGEEWVTSDSAFGGRRR
jgi:hypothetical protein